MNKKIKICFFSPASYPFFVPESKAGHGGAEFQMYLWAKYLSDKPNFDIHFLVGNYGQKKKIKYGNINVIRSFKLAIYETILAKLIKSVRLLILYIKIKPDVVITTNASAIVAIASFYAKIFRKKHVYRSSSIIDVNKTWINTYLITGSLYRWGLENTSLICTQTHENLELVKKNHQVEACVSKNIFPVSRYKKDDKKYILWVSRYVEMKRPYLLLELAKQIFNEQFVMICPYNPTDYEEWIKLKNEADKIPNLTFIEKIPFQKIQIYFNQTKLFINTSDFEGFPNTFLQAAQGKTPIVSLNVNPDNFLNEYNCGIFCNNDFDLLVEKTKMLLQNKEELKIKGENAYNYLKKNHDIKVISKQLEQIIYNILKRD